MTRKYPISSAHCQLQPEFRLHQIYTKCYKKSVYCIRIYSEMAIKYRLAVLLLLGVYSLCQSPQDDLVNSTIPDYTYPIYSGYLPVGGIFGNSSIHYVYYESQKDHQKDPIVIWLTDGEACSIMANMMQETGPLRIDPNSTTIEINPDSWNKEANLVYFQMPSGVGFSERDQYGEAINDVTVAEQALITLRMFLARHTSLYANEIYLAASGYGANYAAELARQIIEANKDPYSSYLQKINLKGILFGNPCVLEDQCYPTSSQRSSKYHYEFLYKRAYFPTIIYQSYASACSIQISSYQCYEQMMKLDTDFNSTRTSAYNIYAKCYNSTDDAINRGCEDDSGILTYFNDQDFKSNWNIQENSTWQVCSEEVESILLNGKGIYHMLRYLIKENLRLWVYSGDLDSTIPITGTKHWLKLFKSEYQIPIVRNWREWWVPGKHKGEDQVGGFIWELEGLTFVSVKAAGFKASQDQPVAMSQVLEGFLTGKTLPYKS